MLLRERPLTPCPRGLSLPHADRTDRVLSALAGTLFLASWATAYVGLVPPDVPTHRTHKTTFDSRSQR